MWTPTSTMVLRERILSGLHGGAVLSTTFDKYCYSKPCGRSYKIPSRRFSNGTIASYRTKHIHFSLQASKSLPVKFQQKDSRRDQELSGIDKKPSRSSVAQNHINRFKNILQKSETTHHSSATINTSIKLSPTRRSASGQSKRPGSSSGPRTLRRSSTTR